MIAIAVTTDNGHQQNVLSNEILDEDDGTRGTIYCLSVHRDDGLASGEIVFEDFKYLLQLRDAIQLLIDKWK